MLFVLLLNVHKKVLVQMDEGLGLVCVVKVCASKLWFASHHDSEASEGIFVGFLKDDGAVCL